MATINDLPPEKLFTIFDKLPLIALVHVDEVSRNWGEHKLYALSQRKELNIFENKRTLLYFDAKLWLPFVKSDNKLDEDKLKNFLNQNALYTKQIPPKMVDNITELMPNLTVIRIQQKGCFTELWKIKFLLKHYRRQLVEVNISFTGIYDAAHDHLETSKKGFREMFLSLITTLNSLEKLDILVLYLNTPQSCTSLIEVDLSVVSRLKNLSVYIFGFNDDSDTDIMQHTLQTYAGQNESLQIGSINWFRLDTLLAFVPQVLAAMREVEVISLIGSEQLDAFKQLARQCLNVEILNLVALNLSMAKVAEALLPCRSLVNLEVYFYVDVPVVPSNGLPLDQLPVLSSVKTLDLIITTTNHRDLEQMNLEVIFPNVQEIKLEHILNRCQDCNFTVPEDIAQSAQSVQTDYSLQIHECQRLTRLSFAKCSKLTKLTANIGQKEIISSHLSKVVFTPETLGCVTYSATRKLIILGELF